MIGPPFWVEPPPAEPGSIDPLGYLAHSERVAEQLLPGTTVLTTRLRYLSFLCWAIRETGNDPGAIDRWEVAFSVGEHLRHGAKENGDCKFLGSRLLGQRQPARGGPLPRRLHVQSARLLYSGLLRSCELADQDGNLSDLGKKIADAFGKDMPGSLPRRVSGCEGMPCLSEIGSREASWLRTAVLELIADGERRARTFREVGVRRWRRVKHEGPAWLLAQYLQQPNQEPTDPAGLLHEAARLELQALPLTRLFLFLYQNRGVIGGGIPRKSKFSAFRVRKDPSEMLADLAAHLRKAASLGELIPPLSLPALKQRLLQTHRTTKAEAPWVDEDWQVLRPGLQPQKPPGVHQYRLVAFSSLLADLGDI